MRNARSYLAMACLLAACATTVSCGTAANRTLQSISIGAPAIDVAGKKLSFTATDHWSASPADAAPLAPVWGVCQDGAPPADVTVSQTGVVTCAQTAKGTYTVFVQDPKADTGPVCNVRDACGRGCQIDGATQFTCP